MTDLDVGHFLVRGELQGVLEQVREDVAEHGGVALAVGQVSDQVEVKADAALVEARSSGVGNVIDNQRVLELPLNVRLTAVVSIWSFSRVLVPCALM